jgi:hypothetical protein
MKKLAVIVSILLFIALLIFWFFYPLRSMIVMSVYSGQQSEKSVMAENGFSIDMPSGEGWYPFVMTFNADGFSAWSGIDAEMSIMYNFGAFGVFTRTSSIYDINSDRYSSFYGAYVVKKNGGAFGFNEEGLDIGEITAAVEYDYTQLVLSAFGCAEPVFTIDDYDTEEDAYIAGSGGWTKIDARITASGCAHEFISDKTPYLQYGPPMGKTEEDFAPVSLYGRVYAKYLEEYGCTILVYVIAPNEKAAEECDGGILSKTVIRKLKQ